VAIARDFLCRKLGIVDRPDGNLKKHNNSVPYLGGIAVFASFLLTVGVLTNFEQETLGLLLSGSIALLVGLIDDFGVLTPSQKLLGQALAGLERVVRTPTHEGHGEEIGEQAQHPGLGLVAQPEPRRLLREQERAEVARVGFQRGVDRG